MAALVESCRPRQARHSNLTSPDAQPGRPLALLAPRRVGNAFSFDPTCPGADVGGHAAGVCGPLAEEDGAAGAPRPCSVAARCDENSNCDFYGNGRSQLFGDNLIFKHL